MRYGPGSPAYGYRLDRLHIVRLGDVMPSAPEPVDASRVLDATAWSKQPAQDVEIQCNFEDTAAVASWFPRGTVREHPSATRLTSSSTNLEAVVDRVMLVEEVARAVLVGRAALATGGLDESRRDLVDGLVHKLSSALGATVSSQFDAVTDRLRRAVHQRRRVRFRYRVDAAVPVAQRLLDTLAAVRGR